VFCNVVHPVRCTCRVCYKMPMKVRTLAHPLDAHVTSRVILPLERNEMQRPRIGMNGSKVEAPWGCDDFLASYPTLQDHLKSSRYDDGSVRVTSTLMIFSDSGVLKICLNDRDNQRSCFVTGGCLKEALDNLEAGLCSDSLEWRVKAKASQNAGYTPF